MISGDKKSHASFANRESKLIASFRIVPNHLLPLLGFYLVSLFICPPLNPAWAGATEEVVNRVQQRYEMTHDLEATFTQRATLKTLNETQLSSGRVYIKKPGKMRWDYLRPENQVIILNNGVLSVYTPGANQLVEQPVADVYLAKNPTTFLLGQGKIGELFWISVEPINGIEKEATWRLILTPKEENPQVKELRLDVSGSSYDIVRSIIVDHFGNVTDIRYTKIRVNRGLDQKIFALKLPPGVQRVKPPFIHFE